MDVEIVRLLDDAAAAEVEAAPEVEARRITADLLRDGRMRDLGVEIWGLGPEAVRAAARAMGPARIFLLGPDLGHDAGPAGDLGTGAHRPPPP